MENFTDIASFSNWMVYSGGAILFVSWLLDQIPAFGNLASNAKRYIAMAASALVALGFYAALTYLPVDTITMLDPWFKIVLGVILAYGGGQVYHALTKK